jgi:hypothetical protein
MIEHLAAALVLADELKDGVTGLLIETALDQARAPIGLRGAERPSHSRPSWREIKASGKCFSTRRGGTSQASAKLFPSRTSRQTTSRRRTTQCGGRRGRPPGGLLLGQPVIFGRSSPRISDHRSK